MKLIRPFAFFTCMVVTSWLFAQPSSGDALQRSYEARKALADASIFKDYPVRNIGPTVQGGRIVDIEVNLSDPKEFYVGYASGGIFKTVNNGITFEPIFDNNDAIGIGDFALSQGNPKVMYAGTGEKNSSRSSYAGSGVYKTSDGGRTWSRAGLSSSHHVGRIIIHPKDDNTVWVGVIGSLYTPNEDRGVFKSTDGGKSWKKTLFINDSTGVIDLVINPSNPAQIFAAAWERSRKAWHFKGNGSGSGIYRSDDGGETWTRLSNGFPAGASVGRIGLDISAANPEMIYATLDSQSEVEDKKKKEKDDGKLEFEDIKKMSKDQFLAIDDKKLAEFVKDSGLPKRYTAEILKKEVRDDKYSPKAIGEYFGGDATSNLIKTKIAGAQVYRSADGGSSWKKMNSYDLDGVFYTYGYYFAEMEVSPDNADVVYIYGVPLLKSRDGGATFHRIDTLRGVKDIHVDHHVVWVNPRDAKHILLGNDGGLYQSYDEGANWLHINNTSVGQFYTVNVDMETPYNVYGGLQDNGVLKGSGKSVPNESKHWEQLFGGDGMYVAPDPRNSKVVYTGYQFGNYYRLDLEKGKSHKITPQHNIGEQPLRWNWRAPLFLSKHNADIVYTAANKVYRSFNKGESWEVISDDLTTRRPQGNVPFCSISTLAESPLKFGLIYAGTDDGLVWVTKNGGTDWAQVSNGLPKGKWVSSVTASPHDEATVFVSLNGYRDDDFETYLFTSGDYGATWKSIRGDLPASVANVIIPDPADTEILYCGLDNGTYVSFDKGSKWNVVNGMLNVPAYDMVVHPRDNELVVGTHGRSVFVMDVKPLQSLKKDAGKGVIAFTPDAVPADDNWGEQEYGWDRTSEPRIPLMYYVGRASDAVAITVFDEKGTMVRELKGNGAKGFHTLNWDGKVSSVTQVKKQKASTASQPTSAYVKKGNYKIRFVNGNDSREVTLEVK